MTPRGATAMGRGTGRRLSRWSITGPHTVPGRPTRPGRTQRAPRAGRASSSMRHPANRSPVGWRRCPGSASPSPAPPPNWRVRNGAAWCSTKGIRWCWSEQARAVPFGHGPVGPSGPRSFSARRGTASPPPGGGCGHRTRPPLRHQRARGGTGGTGGNAPGAARGAGPAPADRHPPGALRHDAPHLRRGGGAPPGPRDCVYRVQPPGGGAHAGGRRPAAAGPCPGASRTRGSCSSAGPFPPCAGPRRTGGTGISSTSCTTRRTPWCKAGSSTAAGCTPWYARGRPCCGPASRN